MAKLRDFKVTLYPAHLDRGFVVTQFSFGQKLPEKRFQASTTDQVIAEAKAFAVEHGEPCQASVTILSGRKPAHFDKKAKDLYYNFPLPQVS